MTIFHTDEFYNQYAGAVSALHKLEHPNILKVYGVCPELKSAVVEYASRGTLKPDFLDWKSMHKLAHDIGSALKYLHSQTPPILHRNLNRANVMVVILSLSLFRSLANRLQTGED